MIIVNKKITNLIRKIKNDKSNMKENMISFQIDCICETLYQAKDGDKLLELFRPDIHNIMFYHVRCSSSVLRAYLYTLYHSQRYEELFQVIFFYH